MCLPFFHKWSKWEVQSEGELTRGNLTTATGWYIRQVRRCAKCGKVQLRIIVRHLGH